ncbi:hypothetical protein D0861_05233 [Hortaea werneckii]|uniref:Uncharacterized protein n=1 Tax=Hortaea werneckii TaxID=91943 RepID=A0A3M7FGB4_HORWE|nr:hypothetical protein D0861_05233 [Hortaea werneckii]
MPKGIVYPDAEYMDYHSVVRTSMLEVGCGRSPQQLLTLACKEHLGRAINWRRSFNWRQVLFQSLRLRQRLPYHTK